MTSTTSIRQQHTCKIEATDNDFDGKLPPTPKLTNLIGEELEEEKDDDKSKNNNCEQGTMSKNDGQNPTINQNITHSEQTNKNLHSITQFQGQTGKQEHEENNITQPASIRPKKEPSMLDSKNEMTIDPPNYMNLTNIKLRRRVKIN